MNTKRYIDQTNWPTDLEKAKQFAREAVGEWKWKDKAPKFLRQIDRATSVKRLQEIVIYPLLSGEGLAVIKN